MREVWIRYGTSTFVHVRESRYTPTPIEHGDQPVQPVVLNLCQTVKPATVCSCGEFNICWEDV